MRRCHILKYVSFLMILTAFVRFVFGLGMLNIFVTAQAYGMAREVVTLAVRAFLLILACAVCEMVCGFTGTLNWEEPLRAGRCLGWGAATLALGIAGNILQSFTGYGVSIVAWTTGVILPALFVLAAAWFFHGAKEIRARNR